MEIVVRTEVGENCITLDAGKKLFEIVYTPLKAGQDVTLDFAGVSVFASPFFNGAVGQLLKDITPDVLNRLLHFKNLVGPGFDVLKRVIDNSKEYYSNPEAREALNDILRDQSEDK